MREKYTTTLDREIKKKLFIIAASNAMNANDILEKLILKEWEVFWKNEMDKKRK